MLLSVVIPTLNRSNDLAELLDSLTLQTPVPFTWEILVVDNASTDDTCNVVKKKISQMPVPLRYVREDKPGLHQGRHQGARESSGDFIAYLDDDTVLHPDWISGVKLLQSGQADAVVSRILPKWETLPPEWLTDLIDDGTLGLLTLLDLGNRLKPISPKFVWGASFFIRNSLVFELGGFNPDGMPPELIRYRGDGESGFFRKFCAHGYRAWYDPSSIACHKVSKKRITMEYLEQRSFNQGISESFSQIRKTARLDGGINGNSIYCFVQRIREKSYADWLELLIKHIKRGRNRFAPARSDKIRRQLHAAHHAGWKYHQSAVQEDPELLAYVLKNNFLE